MSFPISLFGFRELLHAANGIGEIVERPSQYGVAVGVEFPLRAESFSNGQLAIGKAALAEVEAAESFQGLSRRVERGIGVRKRRQDRQQIRRG